MCCFKPKGVLPASQVQQFLVLPSLHFHRLGVIPTAGEGGSHGKDTSAAVPCVSRLTKPKILFPDPHERCGCRDPALAAFEAEEVLQRGSLAFVSNLASSVASGVLGIARAAVVGRQSGYRAGLSIDF